MSRLRRGDHQRVGGSDPGRQPRRDRLHRPQLALGPFRAGQILTRVFVTNILKWVPLKPIPDSCNCIELQRSTSGGDPIKIFLA